MQTVNVIEYHSNVIQSVRVFPDDIDGNTKAELLFAEIIKENGADEETIESCIENGSFYDGDWQVFLVHSS